MAYGKESGKDDRAAGVGADVGCGGGRVLVLVSAGRMNRAWKSVLGGFCNRDWISCYVVEIC